MDVLVECVPNFSEGRTGEVVAALIGSIESIPGVYLLDREMDWDHHRSVLSFVGGPDAVADAAVVLARKARDLIDIRRHAGGHPRVGATDVVPFIPIRGITMDECVVLAKRVGQRIGSELEIPVFLYQCAASQPARSNLEDIRRGGLEGLAQRMAEDPAWKPDFGPEQLHPTAGATIVGARPPLVAYNVNLQSRDLSAAKAIAKSVRASGGGLSAVKAIGVELKSRGIVQVSMNLTNVEETPIHVAYEAVRHEAERRGIAVTGSEIIGLVPQQALLRGAEASLRLEGFVPDQVLETRLEKAMMGTTRTTNEDWGAALLPFLNAVSAGTPTPGGGSVAALAGVLAASLGLMACRVSAGSPAAPPKTASKHGLAEIEERLGVLRQELTPLIQADARAYDLVLTAYRMPKEDASRSRAIAENLRIATEIPLKTAAYAHEVATLLLAARDQVKRTVIPDLTVGIFMAMAALEGGIENARENLKALQKQGVEDGLGSRVDYLVASLVELRRLC